MPNPYVSVVIPHYNDLKNLALCLDAMDAQTYEKDRFELIVADNGPFDKIQSVEFVVAGRARLINVAERGAGPARNGGAAVARGVILAFTDADCRPSPTWLYEGVAALKSFDVVGGAIKVGVVDEARLTATEAFERVFAFKNDKYVEAKGFTVTANLFCGHDIFIRVGPFRNGVPEDVDWCHRATAKGMRLGYSASAQVEHPARHSWKELRNKWRRLDRESFAALQERPNRRSLIFQKALMLPLSAVLHMPRVMSCRDLNALDQRIKALVILYRIRCARALFVLKLAVGRTP